MNNNAYFYLNESSITLIINQIIIYFHKIRPIKAKIQDTNYLLKKKKLMAIINMFFSQKVFSIL